MALACVMLGRAEDSIAMFAFAALFVWLSLFSLVPRGRSERHDAVIEAVGGLVLVASGALAIVDRDAVSEIAGAGRDESFSLLYVAAPICIISGIFFTLRGARRAFSRGSED